MSQEGIDGLLAFAEEAARYFERRDTGGEDMAFWANVTNAENCRKLARAIEALIAERDALRADKDRWRRSAEYVGSALRARETTIASLLALVPLRDIIPAGRSDGALVGYFRSRFTKDTDSGGTGAT